MPSSTKFCIKHKIFFLALALKSHSGGVTRVASVVLQLFIESAYALSSMMRNIHPTVSELIANGP